MPVNVEKLKWDLSEALTALAQGKGYLGIDALADDLEKLGTRLPPSSSGSIGASVKRSLTPTCSTPSSRCATSPKRGSRPTTLSGP